VTGEAKPRAAAPSAAGRRPEAPARLAADRPLSPEPGKPLDRRLLAEQYMPYVHSIANKVKKGVAKEVPFEDLVEYGMIGLLEAADRFDPAQGVTFMTFAYYRIRGAIYDGLRGMGWMSRSDYARARFEERANQYLGELAEHEGGRVPAPPGHAADADGSAAPASALEHVVHNLASAVHGLAAVYVTTMDGSQLALIKDERTPAAEEKLALDQARTLVRDTIRKLSAQERQLLELYYYKDMSLQDVGEKLGLSKSWTSRLHARVIEKLHRMLQDSLG
jgi:RNA polymerase sigma factor for flagellar operon FliA